MKIIENASHPITPDMVSIERVIMGAFGRREAEISATWIVNLCQNRGSWLPIPMIDLETFYKSFGHFDFRFNGLDIQGWVVIRDGIVYLTEEFVAKCYEASPAY
jgi:hypothetical protein